MKGIRSSHKLSARLRTPGVITFNGNADWPLLEIASPWRARSLHLVSPLT
jgi:hypothetical protein